MKSIKSSTYKRVSPPESTSEDKLISLKQIQVAQVEASLSEMIRVQKLTGQRIRKTELAQQLGMSREHMTRRYAHVFRDAA